jgi:glutaredoxin 3
MAKVCVYSTRTCFYCYMAKQLLTDKGVEYEEIDVSHDPARRRWLEKVTSRRTVPQVFIDDKPYGGFTDIAALDRQGKLDALLGLAPA